MARHEVPGGWVEVRDDPTLTPERLRRPVKRVMAKLAASFGVLAAFDPAVPEAERPPVPDGMIDVFDALNDAVAAALVTEWSFPDPVSLDAILGLPGSSYDAIQKIAAPLALALLPDFTADGMGDPKAPGGD